MRPDQFIYCTGCAWVLPLCECPAVIVGGGDDGR